MKKICLYALAALTVAACSKEDGAVADGGKQTVSLSAETSWNESENGTKAGYDGTKSMWTAGDEIGVGIDANNTNLQFTQVAGSLSADGTQVQYEGQLNQPVTGNVQSVAYYPYSASATTSGTTVTTTFPAVETYVANGYTGIPLFGAYSGDIDVMQMQFRNLFSVIKLTLTKDASIDNEVTLESIQFHGNDNENISGAMSVDMSGATPAVTYTGTGKTITLDCGAGIVLDATPKTFYIAVPAMNYTNGYTLTIITDRGQLTKKVKLTGADYAVNTVYTTPALAVKDLVTPFIILDANLRDLLEGLGLIDVLDPLTGSVSVTALGLAATSIDLSGGNISTVVGLGNFPALATLDVSNNNLTTLDVSDNPLLVTLDCSHNQLTTLDVSHNPLLASLNCSYNLLTSLDVSQNPVLASLNTSNNQLTALNVAPNTALLTLDCSTNQITALDVHSNTLLTTLKCYGNTLTTLNISNLAALLDLELVSGTNSIAVKALTVPTAATVKNLVSDGGIWLTFQCQNNPNIQTISLKNNLTLATLTVTGNAALTSLDLTNTPLLLVYTANNNAPGFQVVGKGGIL